MCIRWATVLLALSATPGCSMPRISTTPTEPAILRAVTWNAHAGRGDLRRMADELERGALSSGGAVLLMLQEVTASEIEAIAEPRRWTTAFVQVREVNRETRGNAIVSSVPLVDARILPLPRERQSRAAVAARITLAGASLFVASVHLENRVSWLKGLLGDAARQSQVEALLRALPADMAGIVGGDFNTWLGPHEPAWHRLVDRFDDTRGWPRTPTFGNRLVLDHVLMDLPDGWRATRSVVPDRYGSDHHPVIGFIFGR